MSNRVMINCIDHILELLDEPFMNPNEPPESIKVELDTLLEILREYVYYPHLYMDTIDRCDNMKKNVAVISDTDSAIVSLDAWYRFNHNNVMGKKVTHYECTDEVLKKLVNGINKLKFSRGIFKDAISKIRFTQQQWNKLIEELNDIFDIKY